MFCMIWKHMPCDLSHWVIITAKPGALWHTCQHTQINQPRIGMWPWPHRTHRTLHMHVSYYALVKRGKHLLGNRLRMYEGVHILPHLRTFTEWSHWVCTFICTQFAHCTCFGRLLAHIFFHIVIKLSFWALPCATWMRTLEDMVGHICQSKKVTLPHIRRFPFFHSLYDSQQTFMGPCHCSWDSPEDSCKTMGKY